MPILTPRLMLRPRQVGEGTVIAKAVKESLAHLKPWMPFAHEEVSPEKMEEHCRRALANFILREDCTLSIYDREGKTFIGSTGLHRANWNVPSFHIGYWLHKNAEGKGYVSESTNALTRYAFKVLGARRVEIRCDSKNTRSLAVMQKLGFEQEGLFRKDELDCNDVLRDTIITARTDIKGLPALKVEW